MRQIIVKYNGECARCGNILEVGNPAMYEKSMGIFCVGCEPKETEDIREFRQAKASRKADRYDGWAKKREDQAEKDLNSHPVQRHDIAFCTQPGRIPLRARMNKADDRACESLRKAESMRQKANNLRHVRVAGDAERKRELFRMKQDEHIVKGSRVYDFAFREGTVTRVNKKTYTITFDSGGTYARDKSFVKITDIQFVDRIKYPILLSVKESIFKRKG